MRGSNIMPRLIQKHNSAAKAWNEIPLNIRHSPTIYTFKKREGFFTQSATIPKARSLGRKAFYKLGPD